MRKYYFCNVNLRARHAACARISKTGSTRSCSLSLKGRQSRWYGRYLDAGIWRSIMNINKNDTALVFTDQQIEVLIEKCPAWAAATKYLNLSSKERGMR